MWGFSTTIDPEFAVMARETKMEEKRRLRFVEGGYEIYKGFFPDLDDDILRMTVPYRFVEESWLLHGVEVFGDACDLSLEEDGLESFFDEEFREKAKYLYRVGYGPHNVDSMNQASCLLSLFLNWANSARAMFHDKLK